MGWNDAAPAAPSIGPVLKPDLKGYDSDRGPTPTGSHRRESLYTIRSQSAIRWAICWTAEQVF